MLLYFGVLLFAALFRDSVFTNPVRDAWIAVSQLPFVYALAMKNSAFTVLLGLGYEKVRSCGANGGTVCLTLNLVAELPTPLCREAYCACSERTCYRFQ